MVEEAGQDQPTNDRQPTMTASEVTGLINLFNDMLVAMEGRLIAKLNENSKGETERWLFHEKKHADELVINTKRIVDRFERIEAQHTEISKAILTVETALEAHLKREREEQIAMDARVQPVKTLAGWISKNWKTIALIIALFTTTILAWVEGIEHTITNILP